MNKESILNLVTELQQLRCKFNDQTQHPSIEIEHCRINFNESFDDAIESVCEVYSEIVLDEVETSLLAESKGKEVSNA